MAFSLKRSAPETASPLKRTLLETAIASTPQKRTKQDEGFDFQPFFWSNYTIEKLLGEGSEGKVYGVVENSSGRKYAIKRFAPKIQQLSDPQVEVSILSDLSENCPLLIRYYGSIFVTDPFEEGSKLSPGYKMEWVEGESMQEQINSKVKPSRNQFLFALKQLTEQLACVHEYGIVHRDIKPGNIILTKDGKAKLIDFGIGCALPSAAPSTIPQCDDAVIGTVKYFAPELLKTTFKNLKGRRVNIPTPASDVWALGASLYTWLTGELVNVSSFEKRNLERIAEIQADTIIPLTLRRMLDADPSKRPTAKEILKQE